MVSAEEHGKKLRRQRFDLLEVEKQLLEQRDDLLMSTRMSLDDLNLLKEELDSGKDESFLKGEVRMLRAELRDADQACNRQNHELRSLEERGREAQLSLVERSKAFEDVVRSEAAVQRGLEEEARMPTRILSR